MLQIPITGNHTIASSHKNTAHTRSTLEDGILSAQVAGKLKTVASAIRLPENGCTTSLNRGTQRIKKTPTTARSTRSQSTSSPWKQPVDRNTHKARETRANSTCFHASSPQCYYNLISTSDHNTCAPFPVYTMSSPLKFRLPHISSEAKTAALLTSE